jgi:thiol-disulfide isomerase/thioredoxin
MKRLIILCAIAALVKHAPAQTAPEIIAKVRSSQEKINTAYYKIIRQDTFVTGTSRRSTGEVKIKQLSSDPIFGFAYWGRKDGINRESLYDGKMVFEIDHDKKSYGSSSNTSMIEHSLGNPGGQMVMTEFAKLDTAHVQQFDLKQDEKNYYLIMSLPDIKEYDVLNRIKTVTVDKRSFLPVAVRSRQETLGKVQDIYYEILDMKLNDAAVAYNFASERVPAGYARQQSVPNKKLGSLAGNQLPVFGLDDFENNRIESKDLKGKVVLLDFWEVWCGPCVVSMPKVQELEKKYAAKGLVVYGMMSEPEQLETAKEMIRKRQITFPMLQSDAGINKTFGITAVPTYIVVDREGVVKFTSEGFSEALEKEIVRLL